MQIFTELFEQYPWLITLLSIAGVAVLAWLISSLAVTLMRRPLAMLFARAQWQWGEVLLQQRFFRHLGRIVMPLVVQFSLRFIPGLSEQAMTLLYNLTSATAILFVALAVSAVLNASQIVYASRTRNSARSIKSYVQIGKLIIFALASISIISVLIDRSPLILLSGLGAMSAVLLLVFRDTLLSFVASVQLSSNDMLRVGDWIEMPQVGADGDVVDIALHTVKVQNWDKTFTTIPTYRLIGESFKNWRGMQESGGRRIKRSLRLDTQSIDFIDDETIARLQNLRLLHIYLEEKRTGVAQTNAELGAHGAVVANLRRLTNIGTFRAYALAYLQQSPDINQNMTCMVRALAPDAEGLPVEIYCFTRSTAWVEYERVQGDIFDHLLAILPEFGLRPFQNPAGSDVRSLKANRDGDL